MTGLSNETVDQLLRFAIVGGVSTVAYFLLVLVAIEWFQLEPVTASVASYCTAMLVSYFGQSLLTFRAPVSSALQVSRFVIVSLIGVSVSWIAMAGVTVPLVPLGRR